MARIRATIRADVPPEVAFDLIADFTSTARWDPGIRAAERLDDGPLGVGARFAVAIALGQRTTEAIYTITTHDRPDHVVLETVGSWYRGVDDVRFRPDGDGCIVEWSASFALRGPGRLLDPLLGIGFNSVAAKAVAGLEAELARLAAEGAR
jgi:carbon monoxide dehydrogenase subunit G